MNRKINEVRVDYESVVVRKQAAQNIPNVTETTTTEPGNPTVVGISRSEPMVQLAPAKDEKAK
jgi:vacuolar-type H+-ATPase subunit F/Vma7